MSCPSRRWRPTSSADGRARYPALQVLISQMTQDGYVDVVVSEALSVLRQPKRIEPLRNLLHCGHPATVRTMTKISDEHSEVNCAVHPSVRSPSDCPLV